MNFGGPVWHASAAAARGLPIARESLERAARLALDGVGDISNEWVECTVRALHIRRRLSVQEQIAVGPAIDIRSDRAEIARRLNRVKKMGFLPASWSE